jgi:hypothetical protein
MSILAHVPHKRQKRKEMIMSEEMLIEHCSPTLAGIKTGSLFSCRTDRINDVKKTIRILNRMLAKKGLRILPIPYRKGRALIYV